MSNNAIDFDMTTTERLARTWLATDVGKIVRDLSTGGFYMVSQSGSGVSTMFALGTTSSTRQLSSILISLSSFREVDSSGDVSNIAGNGGILASDTTPIFRGDAAESWEISWATGNVDPVCVQMPLPVDFDGTQDCYFDLRVYSGSTDAATFTIETSWDGAALVSDSCTDTSTKSATPHVVTATISAADVPDAPTQVTIAITPTNAHATNAYQITMARLRYYRLV